MPYTYQTLVGDFETFSETIGALLRREWTKANTSNEKPLILYDEKQISLIAQSNLTDYVKIEEGTNTGPNEAEAALDDSQIGSTDDVIITINCVNQVRRRLIEDEIYRILRKNRPLNGSTINKSNDTEASAILGYDFPLPKFTRFSTGLEETKESSQSQLILEVRYQKNWSD